MGRSEENLESRIEESLRIGRDNAEYKRKMEEWCQHVEIRPTAVGELAVISGLPIGSHRIECPKTEGTSGDRIFVGPFPTSWKITVLPVHTTLQTEIFHGEKRLSRIAGKKLESAN